MCTLPMLKFWAMSIPSWWLLNIKQFARWQLQIEKHKREEVGQQQIPSLLLNSYPNWYPILIGVPNKYNYDCYYYLLNHEKVGNLLLPHQLHLSFWNYEKWIKNIYQSQQKNRGTLCNLAPNLAAKLPLPVDNAILNRLKIGLEKNILIDDIMETVHNRLTKLLKMAPRAEELAYLMDEVTTQSDGNLLSDIVVIPLC